MVGGALRERWSREELSQREFMRQMAMPGSCQCQGPDTSQGNTGLSDQMMQGVRTSRVVVLQETSFTLTWLKSGHTD